MAHGGFLGLSLLIIILISRSSLSSAYKFYVGGKDGWVIKPSEDYSHWAQRNRFQVNDTLYFKYKKGSDSVVVVNKEDYDSCNPKNPIHKMDGGDSTFQFDRSGPFFFISGNVDNCQHGQRLIVVVLSLGHRHVIPSSPLPSPAEAKSPSGSAPSPNPSMGPSGENSPAPSPSAHSGSTRFSGSVNGVALGVGVGVALFFFGSFA